MYSVRQILKENWRDYLSKHNPTEHQKREVGKMMACSKNSCNSRICSSCGKRYTDQWADNLPNLLFPLPHRHVLLTVPSFLRPVLRDWDNIRVLMNSALDFSKNL